MRVPDSVVQFAKEAVCRAMSKKVPKRTGMLGLLLNSLEKLACDAACDSAERAYAQGYNDAGMAAISSLANSELVGESEPWSPEGE